jgi:translation elongation factor EF-Ts
MVDNQYGKSQDVLEEQMLNIGKEKGLVRDLLLYAGARLKCRVTIDHFVRWRVGEGLPKSTADFATEVAKELKKERNQQQKGP